MGQGRRRAAFQETHRGETTCDCDRWACSACSRYLRRCCWQCPRRDADTARKNLHRPDAQRPRRRLRRRRRRNPGHGPGPGQKVDAIPRAQRYIAHLRGDHDTALAQVGGAEKVYDYSVSYNGFAAELTEAQASKLEKVPGVLAVTEDALLQPDTSHTPTFIGLDSPTGSGRRSVARRRPARTSSSASSTPASGPSTRASRTRHRQDQARRRPEPAQGDGLHRHV